MRRASDRWPARARGAAGFTLVELATALFVLGLALALAAPAMPRARTGADAAAHALARVLDRGRVAAMREGVEVSVEVDAATGEFRVLAPAADGADSVLGAGRLPLDGATRLESVQGEPRVGFRFGGLGRAEGGPVRFGDAQGRGRTVTVNRWTGRVRVEVE
ncbi:MAG: GspH/FimT family pseudopilin [Longimicrobiaceae bacterium]